MQKTQLAAALVAVLGFALPATAADKANNELSVTEKNAPSAISKKVNLADEKKEEKKPEKKEKKSHKSAKKEGKGKEGSCKGKEGSCKGKEGSCKGKEGGEAEAK